MMVIEHGNVRRASKRSRDWFASEFLKSQSLDGQLIKSPFSDVLSGYGYG